MTSPAAAVLPYAVGALVASIPVTTMAAVLATTSRRSVLRSFAAGWVAGLLVVSTLGLLLLDGTTAATGSTGWVSWLRLVLAAVLVALAVRKIVARRRSGPPSGDPAWLSGLRETTAGRAFVLSFLLAAVNPKSSAIVLSAISAVVTSTTVLAEQLLPAVLFVVVASLGVVAPLVADLVAGERAGRALESFVAWFVRWSDLVTVTVLLALAGVVGAAGVSGLT